MKKLIAVIALLPSLALAHTGHVETSSFMQGLAHPVFGLDHLLAMVAVGLWASQMRGRAQWAVPGIFVLAMLVGGTLGVSGVVVPFMESGILLSVMFFGLLVAASAKLTLHVSGVLVAMFAVFHGNAHGVEMPVAGVALQYSLGFALATFTLHAFGMVFGRSVRAFSLQGLMRVVGAAIALSGAYLAFA